MKITLDLNNVHQIDLNINALSRASEGLPLRPVDHAPIVSTIFLLKEIKKGLSNATKQD